MCKAALCETKDRQPRQRPCVTGTLFNQSGVLCKNLSGAPDLHRVKDLRELFLLSSTIVVHQLRLLTHDDACSYFSVPTRPTMWPILKDFLAEMAGNKALL